MQFVNRYDGVPVEPDLTQSKHDVSYSNCHDKNQQTKTVECDHLL